MEIERNSNSNLMQCVIIVYCGDENLSQSKLKERTIWWTRSPLHGCDQKNQRS